MTRQTLSSADSIGRISGLAVANAMIFQEILAAYDNRVQTVRQTLEASDAISAFADHWRYILEQINYYPIFHVSHQLLLALPSSPDCERAVRGLATTAVGIVQQRAALRHDLMGRVYHRLLADAKYLGTYYTSIPAATLLLKLALDSKRWALDWADLGQLSFLKVGDLACGTGTLLMAAAEAVTHNYLNACGAKRTHPQLDVISGLLMEQIIHGYDVLPSALHLTASTLAIRAPDVTFGLMHLWSLPLGSNHRRLGSIEFLKDSQVPVATDLFGASTMPGQVTSKADVKGRHASLPDLDLCVMNPPFTRSVGGNLLFGSLPEPERKRLQKELADLLRRRNVYANSTAGLGSVFVATGDLHLKPGGRMALVLPKALLSGVAWKETRELFRLRYQLEYLIVSHDPERWNFSENTDLSEVLVIARKADDPHRPRPTVGGVTCVNLWRNPTTAVEAVNVAYITRQGEPPDLGSGQGALELMMGDRKFGEVVTVPWDTLSGSLWMPPCAFAQSELLRAAHHLVHGGVYLPGRGVVAKVALCPLGQLGTLGPDRRDIHDGFRLSKAQTAYPAFWSHDAATMTTLAQSANRYLSPLHRAKAGRPLRRVEMLWPRAGRVLIAERLWLKTQRLTSVRSDQPVLSNVWWPLSFSEAHEHRERALVLWFNSTLGLITLLAHREETRGAWIDFRKPVLAAMPVLDVSALTSAQLKQFVDIYNRLSSQPLQPFPSMAQDPARQAIDEAIAKALGLPDMTVLRQLLAQEPVVCLRPLS